jgi:acetyl esterase
VTRGSCSPTRSAGGPPPAISAGGRRASPDAFAEPRPAGRAVLDLISTSGRPPYYELSPGDARQFRETRPALTPAPPEVGLVEDLTANGPRGPIPLRRYRPLGVAAATPPGGAGVLPRRGWVIGDIETHDVLCRQLTAQSGVSVVSVAANRAVSHIAASLRQALR